MTTPSDTTPPLRARFPLLRKPRAMAAAAMLVTLWLQGCDKNSDDAVPVTISAQPSAATAVNGGSATFSVAATGDALSFQWQQSTDAGVSWANVPGATAATYVLSNLSFAFNGYRYRAVIAGLAGSLTTTPVVLTVKGSPLQARLGGAALYDPDLRITVLANANLPATLRLGIVGISADGSMYWATAKAWVAALNASNHLGYSDWRLPAANPVNGISHEFNGEPGNPNAGNAGVIDIGFNISAPGTRFQGSLGSEMAFLFYNALGNVASTSITGAPQSTAGNRFTPLSNVALAPYWTSYAYGGAGALAFDWGTGSQYAYQASSAANPNSGFQYRVMVVRNGDS